MPHFPFLRLKLPCCKFIWPSKILQQIYPVTYGLKLPPTSCISPPFHVSLLKFAHTAPNAEDVDNDPQLHLEIMLAYLIHAILNSTEHTQTDLHQDSKDTFVGEHQEVFVVRGVLFHQREPLPEY